MESAKIMKPVGVQSVDALSELIASIPPLEVASVEHEVVMGPDRIDATMEIRHGAQSYTFVVEVKGNGQPRHVRNAIYQLRNYVTHHYDQDSDNRAHGRLIPLLISPYLSPEARSICDDHDVAYLDLFGNAKLAFDSVYIERSVAGKPKSESRHLKSIFSPKAAQILRIILREPRLAWRVTKLAEKASVSLGHVSNVRKALLELEWIEKHEDGVILSNPAALLDAWRENYRRPSGHRVSGYTHLHGREFEARLRHALNPYQNGPLAILSLHSAAQWIAPYGRNATHTFYADEEGADRIQHVLDISQAPKGPNVIIRTPRDEGIFRDAIEPVNGIFTTSPVQTYLDLWSGNERDREAAEFLGNETFPWRR